MKIGKAAFLIAFALASASVMAKPEYLDTFVGQYHLPDNSPLVEKSCVICHTSEDGGNNFNPYGVDLKKVMEQTGGKFNWQTLAIAGAMHSADPTRPNVERIIKGEAPGEPPTAAGSAPAKPKAKPLIPKHAFHPAIVHFPIAFVLIAFLLDVLGIGIKKPILHRMATYNLRIGLLSGFAAMMSGVAAMAFKQFPYTDPTLKSHIISAIASMVCVAISLLTRDRPGKGWQLVSFIAILLAALLISDAGHIGGTYVYGE